LSEAVRERSAGVWVALVIYALEGVYLLGFWSMLDRAAYHLALFGVVSVVIAIALLRLSRWAYWLGLFTFPLCLADVAFALLTSVNFVGWNPDTQTLAFNASMVIYLVFLCFGFLLLIDRRSVLRSDAILDTLNKFSTAKTSAGTSDKTS
jgi:uncharacterized membrane protein (DUF2068 family)